MKPIAQNQITLLMAQSGIGYEEWPEGTIRLEQTNAFHPNKIKAENVPGNMTFPLFLIGRENAPPLKNTDSPLQILKSNRCCQIDNPQELVNVLSEILNNAWSVDNDVYLFTKDGSHILYVSHHDEILMWEKSAQHGA